MRSKNENDLVYRTVPGVTLSAATSTVTVKNLLAGIRYWFTLVVVGGEHEGASNEVTVVPLEPTPTPTVAPTVTGVPSVSPTAGPSVTVTIAPSVTPTGGGAAGGGGGGCSVGDASLLTGVLVLLPLLLAGLKSKAR